MPKYRVEVAFQGDRTVTVTAKNRRQAETKAIARVALKPITKKDIRRDWTDAQQLPDPW